MAKYTFETTDEQEDAITYKRLQLNMEREQGRLPVFEDNASYVTYFVATRIIGPLVAEFVEASVKPHADDFRVAPYELRKQASELLKRGK